MREEVLKRVGADGVLALLLYLVIMDGQKLRRDGAVQHIPQRGSKHLVVRGLGNVAHVRANLRLCQAEVDVIVAGMVAIEGAPAVHELAEILCADVKAVDLVGDIQQHLSTLTRLRVFKGDGIVVMRVADIVKVLVNRLADVDDANLRAELLRHYDSVGLRAGGGAEAGHGAGHDVRRGQAHALDGHGADHDGKRGIHAAGNADNAVVKMRILHALDKAGHLNVQNALTVGRNILRPRGQMRMLDVLAREGRLLKLAAPEGRAKLLRLKVKAAGAAAQVQKKVHVYLRHGHAVRPLILRKHHAVFTDEAQAGADVVRGALTFSGGGKDKAAGEALRLIARGKQRVVRG